MSTKRAPAIAMAPSVRDLPTWFITCSCTVGDLGDRFSFSAIVPFVIIDKYFYLCASTAKSSRVRLGNHLEDGSPEGLPLLSILHLVFVAASVGIRPF
jgi:hypothetical protein